MHLALKEVSVWVLDVETLTLVSDQRACQEAAVVERDVKFSTLPKLRFISGPKAGKSMAIDFAHYTSNLHGATPDINF